MNHSIPNSPDGYSSFERSIQDIKIGPDSDHTSTVLVQSQQVEIVESSGSQTLSAEDVQSILRSIIQSSQSLKSKGHHESSLSSVVVIPSNTFIVTTSSSETERSGSEMLLLRPNQVSSCDIIVSSSMEHCFKRMLMILRSQNGIYWMQLSSSSSSSITLSDHVKGVVREEMFSECAWQKKMTGGDGRWWVVLKQIRISHAESLIDLIPSAFHDRNSRVHDDHLSDESALHHQNPHLSLGSLYPCVICCISNSHPVNT